MVLRVVVSGIAQDVGYCGDRVIDAAFQLRQQIQRSLEVVPRRAASAATSDVTLSAGATALGA
jgi:hypothetical protein